MNGVTSGAINCVKNDDPPESAHLEDFYYYWTDFLRSGTKRQTVFIEKQPSLQRVKLVGHSTIEP